MMQTDTPKAKNPEENSPEEVKQQAAPNAPPKPAAVDPFYDDEDDLFNDVPV